MVSNLNYYDPLTCEHLFCATKTVCIIFSFSYSEAAEYTRNRSKNSLESLVEGLRRQLMDEDHSIPIIAIDALHNPENPIEVEKFMDGMGQLCQVVEGLGSTPVANIQMIKDDVEKLEEQLKEVAGKLEEAKLEHGKEVEKLEEQHKKSQTELSVQKAELEVLMLYINI